MDKHGTLPGISHRPANVQVAIQTDGAKIQYGGSGASDIQAYPELAVRFAKWPIAEEIICCCEHHHLYDHLHYMPFIVKILFTNTETKRSDRASETRKRFSGWRRNRRSRKMATQTSTLPPSAKNIRMAKRHSANTSRMLSSDIYV